MLTTEEFGLEEYGFKSSPESYSDHSYSTDYMDVTSDEDFLTQLSADLDIPLLLNPGEDELIMLNSFFDKSPEEIMSDIASPPYNRDEDLSNEISELQNMDFSSCGPESYPNLHPEVKSEVSDSSSSGDSVKSISPILQVDNPVEIKDEVHLKTPPLSPQSNSNTGSVIGPPKNILYTPMKLLQSSQCLTKHKPIVPKSAYTLPVKKNNVLVLKKDLKPIVSSPQSNVVVLENIKVTTVPHIPTVNNNTITSVNKMKQTVAVPSVVINPGNRFSVANPNIDPRVLKRQQRKIKNRESASLSRKKKKDYVTSLEDQVKVLSVENKRLQTENLQLKERLAQYEDNPPSRNINKSVKPSLFLCVFLLVVGLNLDMIRNPFSPSSNLVLKQDLPKVSDHHGRSLLWATDDSEVKNKSTFSPFSMCPAAINQTESARLVLELERWIGKPIDLSTKITPDRNSTTPVKHLKLRYKKKKYGSNTPVTSATYKRFRIKNEQKFEEGPKNELQVFSIKPEQIYSEFFEAINRQDDTFYVVSFTDRHMLLPAIHHNKTGRPKMSLIMPSMLPNDTVSHSSLIPLMQIDCEVLNTRLIHIKQGSIPHHLKTYSNATRKEHEDEKVRDSNSSGTHYYKKPYKPWIGKPIDLSTKITPDRNSTTPVKHLKLRYKKKKYGSNTPVTSATYKRFRIKNEQKFEEGPKNELQVFSIKPEQIYSEFFEAINRQDDTFYVVSFTDRHMLLPAIHHNKTGRPKMSLIMPSMLPNDTVSHSSLIPLMQIDCEVLNTRLIHIKQGSIPHHLKTYSNATRKEHEDEKVRDSNSSGTHYYKKPYKPYFINNYSLKSNGDIFEIN